jgi:hypothetical protein
MSNTYDNTITITGGEKDIFNIYNDLKIKYVDSNIYGKHVGTIEFDQCTNIKGYVYLVENTLHEDNKIEYECRANSYSEANLEEFIIELSKLYPKVIIHTVFVSDPMLCVCGSFTLKNGQVIQHHGENWNRESDMGAPTFDNNGHCVYILCEYESMCNPYDNCPRKYSLPEKCPKLSRLEKLNMEA